MSFYVIPLSVRVWEYESYPTPDVLVIHLWQGPTYQETT